MDIEIITPDATLFEGQCKYASFPGTDGSLGVLDNHAPLITTLQEGSVKIVDANDKETLFDVKGGVVEVMNNKVIVLAE